MTEIFDDLVFYVNGQKVVEPHAQPRRSLADYLRVTLNLTGTKIGCNEGGCGACLVVIAEWTPDAIVYKSVNACLYPVCAAHFKHVITVEGLVSPTGEPHVIQARLARSHGSQCGFCTPGFVMSMYGLLRKTRQPTKEMIDRAMQGNLCRCTGYRPIMQAFYSFADETCNVTETTPCSKGKECCKNKDSTLVEPPVGDNNIMPTLPDYDPSAQELIFPSELQRLAENITKNIVMFGNSDERWIRPSTIDQALAIKTSTPSARFVFGNTEVGIEQRVRHTKHEVLVDLRSVREMRHWEIVGDNLVLGAGLTLSDVESVCDKLIGKLPAHQTGVIQQVSNMLHWFAGRHVRNSASIGGNIATASPISDLNPIWLACTAAVTLQSTRGTRVVPIDEHFFVKYRTTVIAVDEMITKITIPLTKENEHFMTYKQAQRREDDIAIVNAAVLIARSPDNTVTNVRMAFGGMAPTSIRALKTERMLKNRPLNRDWLDSGLESLTAELSLPDGVPGGMEKFRQSLALSFFFKAFTAVTSAEEQTSLTPYSADRLKAVQLFKNSKLTPVGRPYEHLAGLRHTTGEAIYTDDMDTSSNTLHMQFVLSTIAKGTVTKLDTSAALECKGVVAIITHKDVIAIGGRNHIGTCDTTVFVDKNVTFSGQLICGIVATSVQAAKDAIPHVVVEYETDTPIITIEDAIAAESYLPVSHQSLCSNESGTIDWQPFDDDPFTLVHKGTMRVGGQEHFYMEPHCALAVPGESGVMHVQSSSQGLAMMQRDLEGVLAVPQHKIFCTVQRIGGGFGGKESASVLVAAPAVVAARTLNRPVKCTLERMDDMTMTGTRHPLLAEYKVAVDKETLKLKALEVDLWLNCGHSMDLSVGVAHRALYSLDNCYAIPQILCRGHLMRTNIQSCTAFRGFGTPQGLAVCETFMDELSVKLNVSMCALREANMIKENWMTFFGQRLTNVNAERCIDTLKSRINYDNMKKNVAEFNRTHTHIKRGVALTPTRYGINFGIKHMNQCGALVNIYEDGSVLVAHAGMEMGQGLHTKMTQIVATKLGIPPTKIHIQHTSTEVIPNTPPTAASTGSDLNGLALDDACNTLNARLAPIRKLLPSTASWSEVIKRAVLERVQLSATGFSTLQSNPANFNIGVAQTSEPFSYYVYGAAAAIVEVDCLTGDHKVHKVDIVMDVGKSLNPAIDIGQIEGAFTQGYGLHTMEELKVQPSGNWLTRGPGNYKIPTADDCPLEFNVQLLDGSSNPHAIFSSKAIGEPPLALGAVVYFAIKEAVRAYRRSTDQSAQFSFESPATAERIRNACGGRIAQLVADPASDAKKWTVPL